MAEVKVKLSLCLTKHHAIKTYWGSGGIAPRILNLGSRWEVSDQLRGTAAFNNLVRNIKKNSLRSTTFI
jgi:hypothetical protein